MVGDGSYLMMHTELVTAVAERIKLIVVLIQNHGYASIGSLSESLGSQRFGTQYRALDEEHHSFDDGERLPVDLALNAESLGVKVIRIEPGEKVIAELEQAIRDAKAAPENGGPIVIHVESDPLLDAPSSESWWDVPGLPGLRARLHPAGLQDLHRPQDPPAQTARLIPPPRQLQPHKEVPHVDDDHHHHHQPLHQRRRNRRRGRPHPARLQPRHRRRLRASCGWPTAPTWTPPSPPPARPPTPGATSPWPSAPRCCSSSANSSPPTWTSSPS